MEGFILILGEERKQPGIHGSSWPFDSLEPASLAENECEGKAAASRLGVAWVSRIGQQIRLAQKHCPVQRDRN